MGRIPHRGGFFAKTTDALIHATRDELGLDLIEPDPHFVIILPTLDEKEETQSREWILTHYWRQLFHARVHLSYEERVDSFPNQGEWIDQRADSLGRLVLAEARTVLYEDQYLILPADDRTTFIEFAAVYLELMFFHPTLRSHTFPSIHDHEKVRILLDHDVQALSLFEATRPSGAAEHPSALSETTNAADLSASHSSDSHLGLEPIAERKGPWSRLLDRAELASEKGNNVRAAILRYRAARLAPAGEVARTRAGAKSEIETLTRRLRAAVGFDAEESSEWRHALPAFLENAAQGLWPREARLLYDLQKACIVQEKHLYRLDLLGWWLTLGKRPLKHPLPDRAEIQVLEFLRSAQARLAKLSGPEPQRTQLEHLVEHAIHLKEGQIRERFRDRLRGTLDSVGLLPTNAPERAARRKLVEELLDLIVERGYLRLGDLRDAISRSHIRLNDLSGPSELIGGDALLRADAALGRSFEGVYHRGEIYLRALQRFTALSFGTQVGRLLTRYIALPFGGAFVTLEGLQHMIEPIVHMFKGVAPELFNLTSLLILGFIYLGLINVPIFRTKFLQSCSWIGSLIQGVFYSIPKWILRRPLVRQILTSRPTRFAWDWLIKPSVVVAITMVIFKLEEFTEMQRLVARLLGVLAVGIFINSRQGKVFEEIATDGAGRVGQRIWKDLLPNIFRGIIDLFKNVLEVVERMLYAVDEFLRFRSGESQVSLVVKALAGMVWFVVAYLARIYVNILIEPQINPIKHFPVVTVAAKLMIPIAKPLFEMLRVPFLPFGSTIANWMAGVTFFFLPGLFGFLVWEFKENWKLYAANRSKTLRPVAIGHHGESMSRYLRRGFHSGTIPKLFAKLRRKDRAAESGASNMGSHQVQQMLHHVEETIRHFVDRGILYNVQESRTADHLVPTVGQVCYSTNQVSIELRNHDDPTNSATIVFQECERNLFSNVIRPGWLATLPAESRRVMLTALAGLNAMSDVDRNGDPFGVSMPATPVEWSSWVNAWQGDADGKGHVPVVPESSTLLPSSELTS
jgi:hypothetical protein